MTMFGQILELLSGYSEIVEECLQTMTNFSSQTNKFKNAFLLASTANTTTKRTNILKLIVDRILIQRHQDAAKETKLLFILLRSLSTSGEVAKELLKLRAIDEIQALVQPICKNEKDIKVLKAYLSEYFGFLAAYAYSDDG